MSVKRKNLKNKIQRIAVKRYLKKFEKKVPNNIPLDPSYKWYLTMDLDWAM